MRRAIGILVIFLSTTACQLINPVEKIPAFVEIDSVRFDSAGFGGFSQQEILDVWVYNGIEFNGVFPLPARIPVLNSGAVNMTIDAGVVTDGIRSLRVAYPFYRSPMLSVNLIPGKTVKVTPIFRFTSSIVSKSNTFYADFENETLLELVKSGSDSGRFSLSRSSEDLIPLSGGNFAGKVFSDSSTAVRIELTDVSERTIISGRAVYLELSFKSNLPLRIGLYASSFGRVNDFSDLTLLPSTTWKKIYVNLTEEVGAVVNGKYRIYIRAVKPANQTATIYLDNMRLLFND